MLLSIFDSDNWREIGATLARNKTRTFLTAFGIFWGTAMLAMLHGGATGLEGMLRRNFDGLATNMGAIMAGTTSKSWHGYNKGMSWAITMEDAERIRQASPDIDLMATSIGRWGPIAYGSRSQTGSITGVDADYFTIQLFEVKAGRVLNNSDIVTRAKHAVIGKNLASYLFGDDPQEAIGRYVSANGVYYKVVGVVSQLSEAQIMSRGDDSILLPVTTMSTAYNTGNKVDVIVFTAKAGHSPKEIFQTARRIFSSTHPIDPTDDKAFFELDISEIFENVGKVFTGVDLLAIFVGLGTLLAGVIGVGNIMWIIVRERTTEIGIRRAVGAKPRHIIAQVMSESMVLTVMAGTAGIVFAALVLTVADRLTDDPLHGAAGFQLSFSGAVIILLLFLVLGTIAGIIPALKAMRIKPVEAMRSK